MQRVTVQGFQVDSVIYCQEIGIGLCVMCNV